MKKIKVLIVDDIDATRNSICQLMEFHSEATIVGQAANAKEAIAQAKALTPDVILMDINMPGMDGIAATEILAMEAPNAAIIIMSVQGEQEYLRRAMIAGAKNYLVKPFTGDELLQAVQQVYVTGQKRLNLVHSDSSTAQLGKVITVFSTKGGIGKTTIATNLAVALGTNKAIKVGIIDVDLQFGDVALFLNLIPRATIADLVQDLENLDEQLLAGYLTAYSDNVKVLAAPSRPEQAEGITGAHLVQILHNMRMIFDYVIIDTAPAFNDVMLAVLDAADQVLVVSSMDLPTIKNVKICLEIMESLHYSEEKIKLVLNRADSDGGMELGEVEASLHRSFDATLPSDGKTVVTAVNRGIPFVISNPNTPVAQSVFSLAKVIANDQWHDPEEATAAPSVVSKLRRLFG
jgi:pilus assembly protein CpaE